MARSTRPSLCSARSRRLDLLGCGGGGGGGEALRPRLFLRLKLRIDRHSSDSGSSWPLLFPSAAGLRLKGSAARSRCQGSARDGLTKRALLTVLFRGRSGYRGARLTLARHWEPKASPALQCVLRNGGARSALRPVAPCLRVCGCSVQGVSEFLWGQAETARMRIERESPAMPKRAARASFFATSSGAATVPNL